MVWSRVWALRASVPARAGSRWGAPLRKCESGDRGWESCWCTGTDSTALRRRRWWKKNKQKKPHTRQQNELEVNYISISVEHKIGNWSHLIHEAHEDVLSWLINDYRSSSLSLSVKAFSMSVDISITKNETERQRTTENRWIDKDMKWESVKE